MRRLGWVCLECRRSGLGEVPFEHAQHELSELWGGDAQELELRALMKCDDAGWPLRDGPEATAP